MNEYTTPEKIVPKAFDIKSEKAQNHAVDILESIYRNLTGLGEEETGLEETLKIGKRQLMTLISQEIVKLYSEKNYQGDRVSMEEYAVKIFNAFEDASKDLNIELVEDLQILADSFKDIITDMPEQKKIVLFANFNALVLAINNGVEESQLPVLAQKVGELLSFGFDLESLKDLLTETARIARSPEIIHLGTDFRIQDILLLEFKPPLYPLKVDYKPNINQPNKENIVPDNVLERILDFHSQIEQQEYTSLNILETNLTELLLPTENFKDDFQRKHEKQLKIFQNPIKNGIRSHDWVLDEKLTKKDPVIKTLRKLVTDYLNGNLFLVAFLSQKTADNLEEGDVDSIVDSFIKTFMLDITREERYFSPLKYILQQEDTGNFDKFIAFVAHAIDTYNSEAPTFVQNVYGKIRQEYAKSIDIDALNLSEEIINDLSSWNLTKRHKAAKEIVKRYLFGESGYKKNTLKILFKNIGPTFNGSFIDMTENKITMIDLIDTLTERLMYETKRKVLYNFKLAYMKKEKMERVKILLFLFIEMCVTLNLRTLE